MGGEFIQLPFDDSVWNIRGHRKTYFSIYLTCSRGEGGRPSQMWGSQMWGSQGVALSLKANMVLLCSSS